MELIRDLHNLRPRHRGSVTTMGAFDGVHRGHQAVLNRLMAQGRALNLPSTVVLFEPLPREYFAPREAPPRLMSFREKFQALRALGVDRVLRIRFTDEFRDMGAREFVQSVFVDGLGSRYVIVGDDLHFGRNRAGDLELLKSIGEDYGFEVAATNTVMDGDKRISSTRIRQALEQADFQLAEELLGRPYSISGRVIVGQQLGRTLAAATANLELHRLQAPLAGVYAVEVDIAGKLHRGVANVGTRPTVGDMSKAILEVHILDFAENIYRKNITVIFRQKIRDEHKFESVELLREQIHRDFELGRRYFAAVDGQAGSQ